MGLGVAPNAGAFKRAPPMAAISHPGGTTMTLRTIKDSEHFVFHTAHDLREFLNQFQETDLHAVTFSGTDLGYLVMHWETEVLSDGSEVNNLRI